jgi:acetylornithine deacetylase/succinyl-diaminopimelate desuccinylase-like protein
LLYRPALSTPSDHPFTKAALSAAEQVLGRPVVPGGIPFWCDAALLHQAGIPSVVFGPSGEGLHGAEEWVDVESIKQTTAMLNALVADFCA